MILLRPYSPDPALAARRAPAEAAWAALDPWVQDAGWRVWQIACAGDHDYEAGFRAAWGTDDLLVAEHDIVPTRDHLRRMDACPYPVCAAAYRLTLDLRHWARIRPLVQDALVRAADLPPAWREQWQRQCELWDSAGSPGPDGTAAVWAHRVTRAGHVRWVETGEAWATDCGFGLTRFRRRIQTPPGWEGGTWRDLDSRVSRWLRARGIPVHVHWPAVAHHHEPDLS